MSAIEGLSCHSCCAHLHTQHPASCHAQLLAVKLWAAPVVAAVQEAAIPSLSRFKHVKMTEISFFGVSDACVRIGPALAPEDTSRASQSAGDRRPCSTNQGHLHEYHYIWPNLRVCCRAVNGRLSAVCLLPTQPLLSARRKLLRKACTPGSAYTTAPFFMHNEREQMSAWAKASVECAEHGPEGRECCSSPSVEIDLYQEALDLQAWRAWPSPHYSNSKQCCAAPCHTSGFCRGLSA